MKSLVSFTYAPIEVKDVLKELTQKDLIKLGLLTQVEDPKKRLAILTTDANKLSKAYRLKDVCSMVGEETEEAYMDSLVRYLNVMAKVKTNIVEGLLEFTSVFVKAEEEQLSEEEIKEEAMKLQREEKLNFHSSWFFHFLYSTYFKNQKGKSLVDSTQRKLEEFCWEGKGGWVKSINQELSLSEAKANIWKQATTLRNEIEANFKKWKEDPITTYIQMGLMLEMNKRRLETFEVGDILEAGKFEIEGKEYSAQELLAMPNVNEYSDVKESMIFLVEIEQTVMENVIPWLIFEIKRMADELLAERQRQLSLEEKKKMEETNRQLAVENKRLKEEKERNAKTIETMKETNQKLKANVKALEKETKNAPATVPVVDDNQIKELESELRQVSTLLEEEKRQNKRMEKEMELYKGLYDKASSDLNNCAAELGNYKRKLLALESRSRVETVVEGYYQEHGMSELLELLFLSILEKEYFLTNKPLTPSAKAFLFRLQDTLEKEIKQTKQANYQLAYHGTSNIASTLEKLQEERLPKSVGYITYEDDVPYIVFDNEHKIKANDPTLQEVVAPEGLFVEANPNGTIVRRFRAFYRGKEMGINERFGWLEETEDGKWYVVIDSKERIVAKEESFFVEPRRNQVVTVKADGTVGYIYRHSIPYLEGYDVPLRTNQWTPYLVLRTFGNDLYLVRDLYTKEETVLPFVLKDTHVRGEVKERYILFVNEQKEIMQVLFNLRVYTFSTYYDQKQKGMVEWYNTKAMIRLLDGTVQPVTLTNTDKAIKERDVIYVDEFFNYLYHEREESEFQAEEIKQLAYRKTIKKETSNEPKVEITREVVIVGRPTFALAYEQAFAKIGVKPIVVDGYSSLEQAQRMIHEDHHVIVIPSFLSHGLMWGLKEAIDKDRLWFAKNEGASHLVAIYEHKQQLIAQ